MMETIILNYRISEVERPVEGGILGLTGVGYVRARPLDPYP